MENGGQETWARWLVPSPLRPWWAGSWPVPRLPCWASARGRGLGDWRSEAIPGAHHRASAQAGPEQSRLRGQGDWGDRANSMNGEEEAAGVTQPAGWCLGRLLSSQPSWVMAAGGPRERKERPCLRGMVISSMRRTDGGRSHKTAAHALLHPGLASAPAACERVLTPACGHPEAETDSLISVSPGAQEKLTNGEGVTRERGGGGWVGG